MTNDPGIGEVLKEMPDDQVTDSLRKLCYLQVQQLNQVSFPYTYILYGNAFSYYQTVHRTSLLIYIPLTSHNVLLSVNSQQK